MSEFVDYLREANSNAPLHYRTVAADNPSDLHERVSRLIAEGFRPLGGVSLSVAFNPGEASPVPRYFYAQALIREVSPPAPSPEN